MGAAEGRGEGGEAADGWLDDGHGLEVTIGNSMTVIREKRVGCFEDVVKSTNQSINHSQPSNGRKWRNQLFGAELVCS